ncbi:MAG: hydroxyacid dehydrogenase [Candidatus Rokubacteria bacterium]|nr:hydroxyacid dehydrogenase [Candidatus Rokubacteria bacterium]
MAHDIKPLVIVGGPIHTAGIELLQSEARVVIAEDLTEEGVVRAAQDAEAILFRIKPPCTERLMASCPKLKVVGRYGVGLDTVDLAAATRLGIAVVHAPGSNSDSVAEHALMLMLCCVKKTIRMDRSARRGEWRGSDYRGITELKGATLGIIGVGNIGRRVAHIARGFGMNVLGYDPYVPRDELERREVQPVSDLADLLARADIVTCHTPHTPETHHLISEKTIARMKDGAIFINTSRGKVQDERAVFEALTRGKLRAAGLDVWEEEPTSLDNPLLNLDNVVCTPHVAGVSETANRNIAVGVASEILRVLRGEKPKALGNPDLWPRLTHLRLDNRWGP